jgi:hypothetical protein
LRNSADLSEALGEHVKLETNWWSKSIAQKDDCKLMNRFR